MREILCKSTTVLLGGSGAELLNQTSESSERDSYFRSFPGQQHKSEGFNDVREPGKGRVLSHSVMWFGCIFM